VFVHGSCRPSIPDETSPQAHFLLHQRRFFLMPGKHGNFLPTSSIIGPRMNTISSGSCFQRTRPEKDIARQLPPVAIPQNRHVQQAERSCGGLLTFVASRLLPRMSRKIVHRPAKIFGWRQTILLPSGIAIALWILRRQHDPSHPSKSSTVRIPRFRAQPAAWPLAAKSPLFATIPIFTAPSSFLLRRMTRPDAYGFPRTPSGRFLSRTIFLLPLTRLFKAHLPAARGEQIFLFQLPHVDSRHRFAEFLARLQNRPRSSKWWSPSTMAFARASRIAALENARADEHRSAPSSAPGRIRRRCNSARRKIRHRQLSSLRDFTNQV